jgi:hypothetical protein
MDHLSVFRLSENHFDEMVVAAGGRKAVPDSSLENERNADYVLDDTPIELKLLQEEPLEGSKKATRRQNIASLFHPTQPNLPVIVIDPRLLSDVDRRAYYNLMGRPIQNAVKQGADQLETTKSQLRLTGPRILMAINVGYTSFSIKEFRDAVMNSAQNDTRHVDGVIIGGVYHYSDGFESRTIWPFEYVPINVGVSFASFHKLRAAWDDFLKKAMTAVVKGEQDLGAFDKAPVFDIAFELDGKTYVKPCPKVGSASKFWTNGRPRRNSTGIATCPAVARTYPDLSEESWRKLKEALPSSNFLGDTFLKYTEKKDNALQQGDPLQPVVCVAVEAERVLGRSHAEHFSISERTIHEMAVDVFQERVLGLIDSAVDLENCHVMPSRYVFVRTIEVGQDLVYDTASIEIVDELLGTRRWLLRYERIFYERIFYEYAIALAAAYAVRYGIHVIVYERGQTYKWT